MAVFFLSADFRFSPDDYGSYYSSQVVSTAAGYACLPCGQALRTNSIIKNHFLSKHVEYGVVFVCPSCKNEYSVKRNLYAHIRIYHPELKGMDLGRCTRRKN